MNEWKQTGVRGEKCAYSTAEPDSGVLRLGVGRASSTPDPTPDPAKTTVASTCVTVTTHYSTYESPMPLGLSGFCFGPPPAPAIDVRSPSFSDLVSEFAEPAGIGVRSSSFGGLSFLSKAAFGIDVLPASRCADGDVRAVSSGHMQMEPWRLAETHAHTHNNRRDTSAAVTPHVNRSPAPPENTASLASKTTGTRRAHSHRRSNDNGKPVARRGRKAEGLIPRQPGCRRAPVEEAMGYSTQSGVRRNSCARLTAVLPTVTVNLSQIRVHTSPRLSSLGDSRYARFSTADRLARAVRARLNLSFSFTQQHALPPTARRKSVPEVTP